jgi:hypothetical protein
MCRATTRRSGSGVVKTPGPPILHDAEPKTPRGVHASQEAHGAGNARGAGARDSIGWQTSVRRIARLPCRSIARSIGRTRALAGRKSVAPPDAERGWIKGETVRVIRGNPQDSTDLGMQVSACTFEHDGRRSRAFARRSLTGPVDAGSFGFKVNVRSGGPARVAASGAAHRADSESDSGVPWSDHGNVRGRHGSVTARQDLTRVAAGSHPRR